MWDRKELKAKGKAAFKGNYWPCVLVAAVLGILTTAVQSKGSVNPAGDIQQLYQQSGISPELFAGIILGTSAVVFVISLLVKIFVVNMLTVGGHRFFINNSRTGKAAAGDLVSAYKEGKFFNIFLTMFLKELFLSLWTLLFVIPGIVKRYSYRMVPYILADNPDIDPMEAINKSRQMMDGHKLNTFILDLSFLGWQLLSVITCGIVGIFWTRPYTEATNAELYNVLRG